MRIFGAWMNHRTPVTTCRCLLICLLCFIDNIPAAKILALLPVPWRSHQFVLRGIVKGLSLKGHEVDFYTPTPIPNPPANLRQIQLKDRLEQATELIDDETWGKTGPYSSVQTLYNVVLQMSQDMFTEEQIYNELLQSNKTYDAFITEYAVCTEHLAYFAHKFKSRFIAVLSLLDHPWTNELSGLPDNPSYMIGYQGVSSDKMNYIERMYNVYATISMVFVSYWETITRQQNFADKYIKYEGWESRPKLTQMLSSVDLILVNSHVSIGYPYPKAPHVKEIAGIHLIDQNSLSKGLKSFMDNASHGVIYFSLGSLVNATQMLGGGKFEIFANVFKKLKQNILWKVQAGMPKVTGHNIMTGDWFPQQAVLAHKNTVLFITHGGLQSLIESINNGVPTIGMPVFFDQFKNVKFMTQIGLGLALLYDNITEATVTWSINEVLMNKSYQQRAQVRQALFKDRPMKPMDEAVYWIEYVLKHGNILRPASAQMPIYQVYILDVIVTTCGAIFVFVAVAQLILRRLFTAIVCKYSIRNDRKSKRE